MLNANATRAATSPDHPTLAAQMIEGEHQATPLLVRISSSMAQPAELTVIGAYLHGELLHGFCRLLQKALEARHG